MGEIESNPGIERSQNGFESIDREELLNRKKEVIRKGFEENNKIIISSLIKVSIPSFLLILISLIINFKLSILGDSLSTVVSIFFPLLLYITFIILAIRANSVLKAEMLKGESSETEITRIIDKYAGIVDGIGTALPLFGAAIILYVISNIDPNWNSSNGIDPYKLMFSHFALPFEIKSILILASAKLFEAVFDQLALKYQEIMERVKELEKIYYFNEQAKIFSKSIKDIKINLTNTIEQGQLERIEEIMKRNQQLGESIKEIFSEIKKISLPDESVLREIQQTSKFLNETLVSMKDEKVVKSLDNLVLISGKSTNEKK